MYDLVQRVGFRSFVYGLASDLKLEGWTLNRNDCVEIRIQGHAQHLNQFLLGLERNAPPLSKIESITSAETLPEEVTE